MLSVLLTLSRFKQRNAERKELRESLSTKISFQMLQENYANVDPLALDALFEANNYNYSHTVTALNASLGTNPPPKTQIISANPPAAREETQPKTPVNPVIVCLLIIC